MRKGSLRGLTLIALILLAPGAASGMAIEFEVSTNFGSTATVTFPVVGDVEFDSWRPFGGGGAFSFLGGGGPAPGAASLLLSDTLLNPGFGATDPFSFGQIIFGNLPPIPAIDAMVSPGGVLVFDPGDVKISLILRCQLQAACDAIGAAPGQSFSVEETQLLTLPAFQFDLTGPGPITMTALQPFDFTIGPVSVSVLLKGKLIPEPALFLMLLVGLLVAVPATRLRLND